MDKDFMDNGQEIANYVENLFMPVDALLMDVKKATRVAGLPEIQVGAMDGRHLEVLARLCGAKKAVEFGTLAGYSGICLLRGMGDDGYLYTLEKSKKHIEVARDNFEKAGCGNRVRILEGEALKVLPTIEKEGPFDLVFIDADKANYLAYFYWSLENLRPGGLLLADNCFAFGGIASSQEKKVVQDLRAFNQAVATHPNFSSTMLPTGEGLLAGVKLDY